MGRPRKRPGFVTIGAAVTGRRHEAEGIPCQDVVVHKSRRGNHVIALCDGAGSAEHAGIGARTLAAVVVNHVAGHLPHLLSLTEDQAKQTIVGVARTALLRLAQRNRWDMASLATTLLFAATDGSTFLAGQLGDGRIGVRTGESASWLPLDTASRGEFSNETQFITSSHALGSLQHPVPATYRKICRRRRDHESMGAGGVCSALPAGHGPWPARTASHTNPRRRQRRISRQAIAA
jgi:serine/threonine protein phosphatase PrpC